jgi:uncharacterized protein YndB with AHSA1/START domain
LLQEEDAATPTDRLERTAVFDAPPEAVWEALTDPARLSRWFGARADVALTPGTRASFEWPDGTVRAAIVEVAEPGRALVLRWLPFARDRRGRTRRRHPTVMRFVVEAHAAGTRLTIAETAPPGDHSVTPEARWFGLEASERRPLARMGA